MKTSLDTRYARKGPAAPALSALSALLFLGAACAAGVAGCAAGPTYKRPEPKVPARWGRIGAMSGASAHAGDAGDLSRWWQRLKDPLLTELVEQALVSSPDLRKARARLLEARARRGVAGSARFPTLTASGSASVGKSGPGSGAAAGSSGSRVRRFFKGAAASFSASFDASWEIDLFGKARRGNEAARADLQSTLASLHDARVTLVAEVARNYVETRALQIRLSIARRNLSTQSETMKLTEWRSQAGLVSVQDAEQARANYQQTRAQIPVMEISLAEAEHRLDILLGKAPGTLHARLSSKGGLPVVPPRIAVGIPADVIRRRPDIRAAERKLAAETARIGEARAARYPSFKLSGSLGAGALIQGASGNVFGAIYSLLAGITAPIFDASRLRNQVRIQEAVRAQALVAYEQAVLTALQEVENALVSFSSNRTRIKALTRAVRAARSAAQLARQRYSVGLIDFQSVLDTERTVLSLEDGLAGARADQVLSLIRLYKALGGGWQGTDKASRAPKNPPRPGPGLTGAGKDSP